MLQTIKRKKGNSDNGVVEDKLDFIMNKIDNYKEILTRNEIEKAKLQLKLEISQKNRRHRKRV